MRSLRLALVAGVLVLGLSGCALLRDFIPSIQRPTASVESVEISSLSFTDIGLLATIAVDNPNPVGISLAGFSYSVAVEGQEVISGDQPEGLAIASFEESAVALPVLLTYESLLETVTGLAGRNEASYEIDVALRFDLPVLGPVTIPVRTVGTIPVLRLPRVRVATLSLDSIGITGAELSLTIAVENPNSFSFALSELDYSFVVQNREWSGGGIARAVTVGAGEEEELTFGFGLRFAEFGRTVRDLLLGDDELTYSLEASLGIDPDFALLPDVVLPFERSGEIPLRR